MSVLRIAANEVFAGLDDTGVLIVAFSGTADGGRMNLIPMNLILMGDAPGSADPQDAELGLDTYYIELNDQSRGGYGGLSAVQLDGSSVTLTLTDTGRRQLALADDEIDSIVVTVDLGGDERTNLAEHLAQMFAHEPDTTLTLDV